MHAARWSANSYCRLIHHNLRRYHDPVFKREAGPFVEEPKKIPELNKVESKSDDSVRLPPPARSLYGKARIEKLAREQEFVEYPRMLEGQCSVRDFLSKSFRIAPDGTLYRFPEGSDPTLARTVVGRVKSVRKAGAKLAFVVLRSSGLPESKESEHVAADLQIRCSQIEMQKINPEAGSVKQSLRMFQLNDIVAVQIVPEFDPHGKPRGKALSYPQLLAPCLRVLPKPTGELSVDADISNDHTGMQLWDSSLLRNIYARGEIIREMTRYLSENHGFTQVHTPILAASHGGAAARPFKTTANEFPDRELALRIAPELWLKRLIVSGMDKVFEIGASFRNEGIDKSHNPEFQTCEFYTISWNLAQMMEHTQSMLRLITQSARSKGLVASTWDEVVKFAESETEDEPFERLDFIDSLQTALDVQLPNLSEANAREQLVSIMLSKNIKLPSVPTLPRLLDHLSSQFIENRCDRPTWIVNTPECLSPLAKSRYHPAHPKQRVALRAELFIRRKEVVNCYEEENDPNEQQYKFAQQQRLSRIEDGGVDDEAMPIDVEYIEALKWSMPPIGGWGCGIDRLLMLLVGSTNIRDVLTHGNLRQVTHRSALPKKGAADDHSVLRKKVEDE